MKTKCKILFQRRNCPVCRRHLGQQIQNWFDAVALGHGHQHCLCMRACPVLHAEPLPKAKGIDQKRALKWCRPNFGAIDSTDCKAVQDQALKVIGSGAAFH